MKSTGLKRPVKFVCWKERTHFVGSGWASGGGGHQGPVVDLLQLGGRQAPLLGGELRRLPRDPQRQREGRHSGGELHAASVRRGHHTRLQEGLQLLRCLFTVCSAVLYPVNFFSTTHLKYPNNVCCSWFSGSKQRRRSRCTPTAARSGTGEPRGGWWVDDWRYVLASRYRHVMFVNEWLIPFVMWKWHSRWSASVARASTWWRGGGRRPAPASWEGAAARRRRPSGRSPRRSRAGTGSDLFFRSSESQFRLRVYCPEPWGDVELLMMCTADVHQSNLGTDYPVIMVSGIDCGREKYYYIVWMSGSLPKSVDQDVLR